MECLQSLQETNPELLLTAQQLKETVRDTRYIPAVAANLATIVCKSKNDELQKSLLHSVEKWKRDDAPDSTEEQSQSEQEQADQQSSSTPPLEVIKLGPAIEERLRNICNGILTSTKSKTKTSAKEKKRRVTPDSDDENQLEEFLHGGEESQRSRSQEVELETSDSSSVDSWGAASSPATSPEKTSSTPAGERVKGTSHEESDDDEWW